MAVEEAFWWPRPNSLLVDDDERLPEESNSFSACEDVSPLEEGEDRCWLSCDSLLVDDNDSLLVDDSLVADDSMFVDGRWRFRLAEFFVLCTGFTPSCELRLN